MADTVTTVWANPAYRKLNPSVGAPLVSMAMRQLLPLVLTSRLLYDSPQIHVVRRVTRYAVVRFPPALAGNRPEQEQTP